MTGAPLYEPLWETPTGLKCDIPGVDPDGGAWYFSCDAVSRVRR